MDDARQNRLAAAVESSYRNLGKFRKVHKALAEEYAGPAYVTEDDNINARKYLHLIQQAIEAYLMVLVGDSPKVLLNSKTPEFGQFGAHFQRNLNRLASQIELGDTFEEWVRNAFFSIGLVKVHMADSGEVIAEGDVMMDPGKPYVSNISIDDWVHDGKAKKWSECQFFGDMYRIPYDELFTGMYPQDRVEGLMPNTHTSSNSRTEDLGQDDSSDERFEDEIDLADIYVPREGMIYTFVVEDRSTFQLKKDPIATMEWEGGETGPYHALCLLKVPENLMPASIAAGWMPSEKLANMLMRKSARQAYRSKEVGTYTPSGSADAAKIRKAGDGEFVEVMNPDEVGKIKVGGVDSSNHAFMLQTMQLFNKNAGNIDQMMGLAASTDTVGQEKILSATASRREDSLKRLVNKAAGRVFKDLGRLMWSDEFTEIRGQVNIDGFPEYATDDTWNPGERQGSFDDFDIEVDVFSMQQQGPGERVTTLTQVIMGIYMPLMQMLSEQGGVVDMASLTDILSEYLNSPQLKEIIKFIQPAGEEPGPEERPRKSPVSNRTYTRRNVSGDDSGSPDPTAVAQAEQQPQT